MPQGLGAENASSRVGRSLYPRHMGAAAGGGEMSQGMSGPPAITAQTIPLDANRVYAQIQAQNQAHVGMAAGGCNASASNGRLGQNASQLAQQSMLDTQYARQYIADAMLLQHASAHLHPAKAPRISGEETLPSAHAGKAAMEGQPGGQLAGHFPVMTPRISGEDTLPSAHASKAAMEGQSVGQPAGPFPVMGANLAADVSTPNFCFPVLQASHQGPQWTMQNSGGPGELNRADGGLHATTSNREAGWGPHQAHRGGAAGGMGAPLDGPASTSSWIGAPGHGDEAPTSSRPHGVARGEQGATSHSASLPMCLQNNAEDMNSERVSSPPLVELSSDDVEGEVIVYDPNWGRQDS